MPTSSPRRRRTGLLLGAGALALLAGAALARTPLTSWALGAALRMGGATEVTLAVEQASPWQVVVEDLGFRYAEELFRAKRVTMQRRHWWSPSLGSVRVEEGVVPVDLAKLAAATERPAEPRERGAAPAVPVEEISFDGQVVLRLGNVPDQALTVKFDARQQEQQWRGDVAVSAPGLELKADASYAPGRGQATVRVPEFKLELRAWRSFLEAFAPVPIAPWEVEGTLQGELLGQWHDDRLGLAGKVQVRQGRVTNPALELTAEGIEADLDVTDFVQVQTKPSALRVRELHTGKVLLTELAGEVALVGADRIAVTRLSAHALGGTVALEPFELVPSRQELDAVLLLNGISAAEVMALTQDLPARATGRLSGRVPLHVGANGVRFGTGWLGLAPGSTAEIQFNAAGLLTAGTSPRSPSYAVLQRIESGLLKLNVRELRLDIRPPDAPASRSARLRVSGEPVDQSVKAPVTLDLNVNGPIESLLNLGLKSGGVSLGTKP